MSRYTRPPETEMIMDEDKWPCWPFLPMKNHGKKDPQSPSFPLLGVIISGRTNRVILANMCDVDKMTDETPAMEYPSIAAMLADGWIVD